MKLPHLTSRRRVIATVAAATVVLNGVAYLAVRPRHDAAVTLGSGESRALVHRRAGLQALDQGQLDKAVSELESAQRLAPAQQDLKELLAIAREAAGKAKPGAAPAPRGEPAPTAAPAHASSFVHAGSPLRKEDGKGTLLVTSVPSGLKIRVDGKSLEVTPLKVRLAPGLHTVDWLKKNDRVLTRMVTVRAGDVASVDGDTTASAPTFSAK